MQQQGYRPVGYPYLPVDPPNGRERAPKKRKKRVYLLFVSIFLFCAAIYGLYYGRTYLEVLPYAEVFAPNITIDGIELSGKTYSEAENALLKKIEDRQKGWSINIIFSGHTYTNIDFGTLGVLNDYNQVYSLLNEAWKYAHDISRADKKSVFEKKKDIDALMATPYTVFTSQSSSSDTKLNEILDVIAKDIARDPVDAAIITFDPNGIEPFIFRNESFGRRLNTAEVKNNILQMSSVLQSGNLELSPEIVNPSVTRADLEKTVALLATGSTPIDKNSTENRTNNIRTAFSKINGKILKPGERFSFNNIVGWRTLENGFSEAVEYAYGELVLGIGGGVCQASTTIYLAAVCAGMEITDRSAHSDPVSYTSLGQDATVYMTRNKKIDFGFRNNTDGLIYLTAHVEVDSTNRNRYICKVSIYGKSLGNSIYYRLVSKEIETIPAPVLPEKVKDTKAEYVIYSDQEYKVLSARDGHVVETYLQRVENGTVVSEKLISKDTYLARAAKYYIGVTSRE